MIDLDGWCEQGVRHVVAFRLIEVLAELRVAHYNPRAENQVDDLGQNDPQHCALNQEACDAPTKSLVFTTALKFKLNR